MTTFAELVNRCEQNLNDESNATWTAEQIVKWINDGIRDYSQHFPRIKTQTISTIAATNVYNLASDFMGILSVEYPTGEDPQEYISRLAWNHADFWTYDTWYDILPRSDDTDTSEIWISDDPAGTETIEVQYHAHHDLVTDADDTSGDLTVPPIHQDLIVKFAQWQATNHLLFAEQTTPTSNSSLLMAQLSQNARRFEASYHTSIQQAIFAADGESKIVQSWIPQGDYSSDDSLARIY
jgi:hypothetical protein